MLWDEPKIFFLERRYFFSIILSEFLKNRVALHKRPARRHGMWQYTSRGRVSGISGPVDLSRTEKDYPALLHRAGLDCTIL